MPDAAVRPGTADDLPRVAEIQTLSPAASQWDVRDYLAYDFYVAVSDERVRGFLVARRLGTQESEVLTLAVDPGWRRKGVAKLLLADLAARHRSTVWLEVRESNQSALALYKAFGFEEVTRRPGYYEDPPEGAVVMKYRSCYCHR